ncbi:MAG: cupredoxin domain-containing protein [bacterium]
MKINFKWLSILALLAVLTWHCEDLPTGVETRGDNEVWIFSGHFEPSTLTVSVGTRVTWKNKDSGTHSVDPGTLGAPTKAFIGSRNLDTNDTFSVTFSNAGSVKYYCAIHQNNLKEGTIIVQ